MESANYIPLGDPKIRASFDEKALSEEPLKSIGKKPVKRIGATPGERKQIAREIRNAAKKEKKKAKSDAKKARKINDIMTRRANKNPEKYNKNKERNRLRDIEYERHKIRMEAVKQAQRLAAIHDPTGKTFNVNPVYVTEDGKVKTVKQPMEENKEKAGATAAAAPPLETVNPDRHALISGIGPPGRKLSNKQKKRLAMYGPKPIPPKPILPEGVTIPEGEENFIAMFDIDDVGVQKRLNEQKRQKNNTARIKRNNQKLASQFKRAMKLKKKQALNMGLEWDPVKAKAEIQGNNLVEDDRVATESDSPDEEDAAKKLELDPIAAEAAKVEERRLRREKKRHERLLEGMRIAEEEEIERSKKKREAKARRKEIKRKIAEADAKAGIPIPEPSKKKRQKLRREQEAEARGITLEDLLAERAANKEARNLHEKRKRSEEAETTDNIDEEPEKTRRKRSKTVEEPEGTAIFEEDKPKKSHKKKSKHTEVETSAAREDNAKKPHKKSKHTEEEETPALVKEEKPEKSHKKKSKHHTSEPDDLTSKEHKKQKKRKASELSVAPEVSPSTEVVEADESSRKKRAKTLETNGAEQWNVEALTGDAARKDKFLRLLGAGKSTSNGDGEGEGKGEVKKKKKSKVEDIRKVENELEMQFEASRKIKYDNGGKKRGLGA
ncbi:hypothetical protein B7494_g7007 [Chlorociboria aeruginascens]|nr:hypothetical protein B7494_g7007 [Chlorociboria aeruginascens]